MPPPRVDQIPSTGLPSSAVQRTIKAMRERYVMPRDSIDSTILTYGGEDTFDSD